MNPTNPPSTQQPIATGARDSGGKFTRMSAIPHRYAPDPTIQ